MSSVAREGETDAARPSTLQPLAGKVVLVTGGGRGIGRAIAQRVATEGASVVVADSGSSVSGAGEDVSVAPEAAAGIVAAGRAAVSFSEDIAASGGAERAVELAVSTFGRIDGLVCCAGNFRSSALMDLDDAHWDDVIRVHLRGQFACLRAVARRMRQQPEGGSIILFSSVGGVIGSADQVAYSSAKAGVLGLLVSASRALQPHNIRVNAVLPGASTRMTDALWAQASTADVNGISVPSDSVAGTWRDPANVAPFVSLLLSDASQMLTSQAYAVVGYQVTQVLLPRWGRTIRSDGPWSTEELAHKVQSEFEPLVPLGLDAWPPS